MSRVYDDDTTIDDKLSCDQLEVACSCGYRASTAWGLWPREMKLTPLRKLQPRFVCLKCGKRRPTIRILAYGGGGMQTVWQWPRA